MTNLNFKDYPFFIHTVYLLQLYRVYKKKVDPFKFKLASRIVLFDKSNPAGLKII